MKKLINVTQEDIDNGKRNKTLECPNALALSRALGESCHVGINWWWRECQTGKEKFHPLPNEAIRFLVKFDAGSYVEPYSFSVAI